MEDTWNLKVQQLHKRRLIIWIPLGLAFLTAYFHRVVIGVVADSVMIDFSIHQAAELGLLASIYFYTYALLQVPAGFLADRYGPRLTVSAALLLAACGAAILGLTDSMTGLYGGRFLASIGVSLLYVNIIKIQAEWFRVREFGTICGLLTMFGNGGALLAATPLAIIVDSLGWRASFYIIGGYSLVMAVICWVIVRDRPTDVNLPSIAEVERREGIKQMSLAPENSNVIDDMKVVFGNYYTWTPFWASVAIFGVYMSFAGIWGVPYFMQIYDMSRVNAANLMMAVVIGNMVGAPLLGYLSDRIGFRRGPYISVAGLFLITWLVLTLWNGAKPPEWALFPICVGIGLGVSGVTLTVACSKEVNPPHLTGFVAGIANSGPFVGAALLQPAFGWVLDRHWQGVINEGVKVYPIAAFQGAFWVCGAVLAVGFIISLFIKETKCHNISAVLKRKEKSVVH
ncbi:putative sulfoacetate transporter SauU [bioreactor metagenome]|uniref:Lysosomal dipeptide transporter MFSD1 n=1 Tax=bioreactor metagenome TaxID=1076179 RepID=A0A644TQW4_9ZZZZ